VEARAIAPLPVTAIAKVWAVIALVSAIAPLARTAVAKV
jgi:hypothetical protein